MYLSCISFDSNSMFALPIPDLSLIVSQSNVIHVVHRHDELEFL